MKKLFLIPLLACFSCVMAWAADAHVSTIADLNAKLADASVETIYLDADLTYTTEACINILRSVTIDGQGHTLSGQGIRTGSTYSSLAINQGAPNNSNWIDSVALKNLTIRNTRSAGQALNVRCNLSALLIDKCEIITTNAGGNSQPITFGGNQSTPVRFYVYDSKVTANTSGYPVITFNPIALTTRNTTYTGYCGLYFKGPSSSAGSRGSVVNANACNFECPNVHSGVSNAFSCFPIADDGITLNLHNCGINNQQIGDQNQALVTTGNDGLGSNRHAQAININISGDNSHINVGGGINKTFQNLWGYNTSGYPSKDYNDFADINITITGGTYSVHPQSYDMAAYGHWIIEDDQITSVNLIIPEIPAEYEVQEVQQGAITLYRVVKKAATYVDPVTSEVTLYDLNDDVPTDVTGEGINPATSFELSTGGTMELDEDREVTKAGYVQVKDNEDTGNATIVKVGTTETADPTQKVDQTLLINNGLDVQGESQVIVQAGSTLQIGEGGINTEKPENIIIEADENGAASLLLDPTITVNQTPDLTVKMTAQGVGKMNKISGSGVDYFWHRFALPVDKVQAGDGSWTKDGHSYATLLYKWDYENNAWVSLSNLNELKPFYGYTLSVDEMAANPGELKDAGYIFKGKLTGNVNSVLDFSRQGYNFFGNSYTGYISVLKLVDELLGNGDIDGTVWMWNTEEQQYEDVPLNDLRNNPTATRYTGANSWRAEVAPMQTFILRLLTENTDATANINYATAVWGNPRYSATTGIATAPARRVESSNDAYVRIIVTAANGKKDAVKFYEDANLSDANDRGFDAAKYMNERTVNVYSTVNGENYGTVATNNIEGKQLTINTIDEIAYTISFADVEGSEYALRDNVTGTVIAIEEGATYEFAAQPNSMVEGRFEIVRRANMPTTIENTEIKANVKGIYTIMGQYLGENFDILPAGVYVVNGVKIVK